ncbi:MAG: hypothetical protein HRU41_11010 [Saprospiraceae bacterium]|nr:hypothetical protein [Saprospiraceae bacterium]
MNTTQIVTITFFQFAGMKRKWWGFKQMGLAPAQLAEIPGLVFSKMLGSGGGNGFQIWPNLGVYGLLGVWESEAAAHAFIPEHPLFTELSEKSREQWTVFMRTSMAHGTWDGVNPFEGKEKVDEEAPICVITRATIKTNKLWQFWRFVPRVSRAVGDQTGRLFSVGVGELPLIQQATFSLWNSSREMKAYAYHDKYHKEVIRRTRELGWYKEELFARFTPYAERGTWQGKSLITDLAMSPK